MILSGSIWEIDALGTFGKLVRWGPLGNLENLGILAHGSPYSFLARH